MDNNQEQIIEKEVSKDDEIKALREEVALLKKEREEQALNDSINKRIDELVTQRLNERDNSERERIEKARQMIAEADQNSAMEKELMANDKYNQISNWKENKIKEFKRELEILAQMGREGKHSANMYRDFDRYKTFAARGDERAKNILGRINLIYAAMNVEPDKLVDIFKKNIGIVE